MVIKVMKKEEGDWEDFEVSLSKEEIRTRRQEAIKEKEEFLKNLYELKGK